VTYDEAFIVTRGAYTVRSADGIETTARPGQVIFLRKGTSVVYSAKEEGAEVVHVTHPHWMQAQAASEHAALLDTFQPTEERPERRDPVALLRSIYDPLERGESQDFGPLFDALAEDVVLRLPVGEAHGKHAVIGSFVHAAATLEFNPFVRPLEYFGDSKRVVQVGGETSVSRRPAPPTRPIGRGCSTWRTDASPGSWPTWTCPGWRTRLRRRWPRRRRRARRPSPRRSGASANGHCEAVAVISNRGRSTSHRRAARGRSGRRRRRLGRGRAGPAS
jgi:hypothetical protein